MDTNTIEKLNASFKDLLRPDEAQAPSEDVVSGNRERSRGEQAAVMPSPLPRRIDGGFSGLSGDLERRAKEWLNLCRVIEHQRPQLDTAEAAYADALTLLKAMVPAVEDTSSALAEVLGSAREGDISSDVGDRFTDGLKAVDELERIVATLATNLLWVRSAWEQYAKSILRAQKLRDQMQGGSTLR